MDKLINLPPARMGGLYRIRVLNRDRKLKVDTGWFENLITNVGLEALGEAKELSLVCLVGTGNATPSFSNTSLQTPIAKRNSSGLGITYSRGIVTSGDRYSWQRKTYEFAQGDVIGNVAEVGIGWADTLSSVVFSRSLVSPAISVLSTDILIVTYELRMYLPVDDATGMVTLESEGYSFVVRPINASSTAIAGGSSDCGWGNNLLGLSATVRQWTNPSAIRTYAAPCVLTPLDNSGLWTSTSVNATQISGSASTHTNETYEAGQLRCNFVYSWALDNSNHVDGIGGVLYSGMFGAYQCIFDDGIPKTNTKLMTLRFRQSWARR